MNNILSLVMNHLDLTRVHYFETCIYKHIQFFLYFQVQQTQLNDYWKKNHTFLTCSHFFTDTILQ